MLKADLREAKAVLGVSTPKPKRDPLDDHPLMPVWQELRPLIERRWPDGGRCFTGDRRALSGYRATAVGFCSTCR